VDGEGHGVASVGDLRLSFPCAGGGEWRCSGRGPYPGRHFGVALMQVESDSGVSDTQGTCVKLEMHMASGQ